MQKFLKQKNRACPQCLKHSFCRRGFTLVETLVAISIFTTSILGLMSIFGSGISNTNYAKQKITAGYLAQEGIEKVRNMRDTDVLSAATADDGWNTFITGPLPKDITYDVSIIDFPGFTRSIVMDPVTGTSDEVKITSTVTWTQNSGSYNFTLSENLYNWIE